MGMGKSDLQMMTDLVKGFCEERDWSQFHNAKDLAIGIATEAGELLEIFRFQGEEDVRRLFAEGASREHIEDELADVLFFVLRFAQMNGISLPDALSRKVAKNARKYPVELSAGSNAKR